jgi:hypothetical protein
MKNNKTASAIYLFALRKAGKPLPPKPKPARAVGVPMNEAMLDLINDLFCVASAENIAAHTNDLLNSFFSDHEKVATTSAFDLSNYVFMNTSLCTFFAKLEVLHTKMKFHADR